MVTLYFGDTSANNFSLTVPQQQLTTVLQGDETVLPCLKIVAVAETFCHYLDIHNLLRLDL